MIKDLGMENLRCLMGVHIEAIFKMISSMGMVSSKLRTLYLSMAIG